MRKRLKKKLGLLRPMSSLRNVDGVFSAAEERRGVAAYRALVLGSMYGYAAMETTPNGDGTYTHCVTSPTASRLHLAQRAQ